MSLKFSQKINRFQSRFFLSTDDIVGSLWFSNNNNNNSEIQ